MHEKGTSLIETAIAVPIVLFLVIAIFTLTFAGYNKVVVTSAARVGAREYAISGSKQHAKQVIEEELSLAIIRLSPDVKLREDHDSVEVVVSVSQPIFVPGLSAVFSDRLTNRLTLSASAKYKKEGWQ